LVNEGPRHVRTTGDGFQKLSGDLKRPYEPLDPPYRNDRSFKNLTLAISARLGARGCVDMSVAPMNATLLWPAVLGELVDDRDGDRLVCDGRSQAPGDWPR
jgi:hypothetical protein